MIIIAATNLDHIRSLVFGTILAVSKFRIYSQFSFGIIFAVKSLNAKNAVLQPLKISNRYEGYIRIPQRPRYPNHPCKIYFWRFFSAISLATSGINLTFFLLILKIERLLRILKIFWLGNRGKFDGVIRIIRFFNVILECFANIF